MKFLKALSDSGRVLLHMPVGISTVAMGYCWWWLAVLFAAGFLAYELNECQYLRDRAYKDIRGWLWGMFIAWFFMALRTGELFSFIQWVLQPFFIIGTKV